MKPASRIGSAKLTGEHRHSDRASDCRSLEHRFADAHGRPPGSGFAPPPGPVRRRAARPRRGAGGWRRSAASRPRSRARRGRRRCGAARLRTSSRSAAAASANRARTRRLRVSTWTWRPVSGSTSHRSPAGTSSCSRGSTISTASTPWRARSCLQRRLPVALAAEVGHDHDQAALAADGGGAGQRRAERRRAGALGLDLAAQLGQQREQAEAALARAHDARSAAAERQHAEPVAAPGGDVADGQRDALGDVPLAPVGGAERHRRGRVEHQPARQRALADVHAHVRLLQPRGRVPVDVADVVAGEVRPDHRQLGAGADLRREVLAGQQALDPLHHREVERPQDRGRDGAGTGLVRRAVGRRRDQPHREPPAAHQPEAGADQQQHQRAAGERRRHLLLLLGLGQPRPEVRVDRLQPARVGGGEELAAGVARDLLQRQQVGRDALGGGLAGVRVRCA